MFEQPTTIPPKFDTCTTCGERTLMRLGDQGRAGMRACRTCDGVDTWPKRQVA